MIHLAPPRRQLTYCCQRMPRTWRRTNTGNQCYRCSVVARWYSGYASMLTGPERMLEDWVREYMRAVERR